TLTLGSSLPTDSKYRLFVCFNNQTAPTAFIRDVLNQRLDGNADGTAGDDFTIDFKIGPAPTVTSVATGTNNTIADNATIIEPVGELRVTFDRAMDGATAGTTANYKLIRGNGPITTVACGGLAGNDTSIAINTASYDAGTNTTTLSVNGGAGLAADNYRLCA